MRPAFPPPRPLAGCRQRRSSIDGDPSFSIHLSLCSTGFRRLPCYYEEIRLLHGPRPLVVASLRPTACADPCRPPRVRTLDLLPLPSPLPLRPRLDFGRRLWVHAYPVGPDCPGLHLRSVLLHASGFFPTPPRDRAVAFGLWLLPTRSTEDLHLLSSIHAWHTPSAFGRWVSPRNDADKVVRDMLRRSEARASLGNDV